MLSNESHQNTQRNIPEVHIKSANLLQVINTLYTLYKKISTLQILKFTCRGKQKNVTWDETTESEILLF